MRPKALVLPAAAVLVTAAATLALPVAPAEASDCQGVSVVVDFGVLGGGIESGCGGAATVASAAFQNAGFTLTAHPRQPGFVCEVAGKPSDGNCMGTTAYWGFFVDVGDGWVYASQGVYQQPVDAGDSVALVWQCSQAQRKPGEASSCTRSGTPTTSTSKTRSPKPKVTPRATPKPTRSPTTHVTPTGAGSMTPTSPVAPASTPTMTIAATSPSAVPPLTEDPTETLTGTSTSTPMPSESPTVDAATEPASADDGGLPGWVPPVLVAVLVASAGGVAWARRGR